MSDRPRLGVGLGEFGLDRPGRPALQRLLAEIDAALCNGPGLRWALMGPHMTYHLGGGEGGIAGYLAHLGPSQVRRWQSLGTPSLDADVQHKIIAGVAEEAAGRTIAQLEEHRDEGLLALLRVRKLVSE